MVSAYVVCVWRSAIVVVVVVVTTIIIIIVIITEKFIRQLEWHLLLAITEKQEAQQ